MTKGFSDLMAGKLRSQQIVYDFVQYNGLRNFSLFSGNNNQKMAMNCQVKGEFK